MKCGYDCRCYAEPTAELVGPWCRLTSSSVKKGDACHLIYDDWLGFDPWQADYERRLWARTAQLLATDRYIPCCDSIGIDCNDCPDGLDLALACEGAYAVARAEAELEVENGND